MTWSDLEETMFYQLSPSIIWPSGGVAGKTIEQRKGDNDQHVSPRTHLYQSTRWSYKSSSFLAAPKYMQQMWKQSGRNWLRETMQNQNTSRTFMSPNNNGKTTTKNHLLTSQFFNVIFHYFQQTSETSVTYQKWEGGCGVLRRTQDYFTY